MRVVNSVRASLFRSTLPCVLSRRILCVSRPRRVRLGHPLHLLEAGDCVAHVSGVMNGFFTVLGEREVFIDDMIAASLGDLGHAS